MNINIGDPPSISEAKNVKEFSFSGLKGYCICDYIYDIDSFDIVLKMNDDCVRLKTRLNNIDGPEIRNRNLTQKQLAYLGKQRLQELIFEKPIQVELFEFDKYGRVLVSVLLNNNSDLAETLINEKYAQPYNGGSKGYLDWNEFIREHWPNIKPYEKTNS